MLHEEVTIRVYLFFILAWSLIHSCASRQALTPSRTVAYSDLFSVNRFSTKSYPQQKKIDYELREYLELFLKDAERYNRLDLAQPERLRIFKFASNELFRSDPKLMASCFSQRQLVYDFRSPGLRKPGKLWLEIEINEKLYRTHVGQSKKRAKYVLYHLLFHCFYQEGHLPAGHVGIMENDFYDPRDTRYQKTDEELVRELFSDKSFDILPDTR